MTADLKALLARVEAAEGPDRELDRALTLWRHPELAEWPRTEIGGWLSPKWGRIAPAEHFTASLDAALALCEREFSGGLGWWIAMETAGMGAVLHGPDGEEFSGGGVGKDLCTALLAALLKALIAQAGSAAA